MLPPLLLCSPYPDPSLDYQTLIQSSSPSPRTLPDVSFILGNHLPVHIPQDLLLQEIFPIVLALNFDLKLVLLNHLIVPILITLPRLLFPHLLAPHHFTTFFILLLLRHLLITFNEITFT